ncbi:MAG: hypothetical protein P1V20_10880 [Verrucomicrobiales bacterium]|nr:hypothetical protein [Verrucomicrobiales bacterium]
MKFSTSFSTRLSSLSIFFITLFSCIVPDTMEAADTIQFIENFALAKDREKVLEQLIPGTPEYYYFHALHYQNEQQWDQLAAIMEQWVKRYGETREVWEIRNREALLRYPENNKITLDYLKAKLGLQFNHQQQKINAKPDLPTKLDPKLISTEAFRANAFRQSRQLNYVEDSGLDWLLRNNIDLDPPRRRDLLQRISTPDYERLIGLIAADLRSRESRGFGEFPIHRQLLPDQLDALEKSRPELSRDTQFIYTKISKLHPGEDIDWKRDEAERGAYLNRVWDYVKSLDPAHNSLKGHVLYQLLLHHRANGEYPEALWNIYLKLPKHSVYVEPDYLRSPQGRNNQIDLNADFREVTSCPPIGNDEHLVREYLLHRFADAGSYQDHQTYIKDTYLKRLFAEAKLTAGKGDAENWYSLLHPSEVQNLKHRVDIDFAPVNKEQFSPGDDVVLHLDVKNVSDLVVKVYEINTLNFYLDQRKELNTDLSLDGLIANEEFKYHYEENSIIRKRRSFDFKSLNGKRGVWIIEFIGNGVSSRALVRKGQLQYLSRTSAAGIIVTVLDETNQKVKNPSVWFGGKEYRPDQKQRIILPFSASGRSPMILTDGNFSELETIELPAENYHFEAGFHIERETLLPGTETTVAIRPVLTTDGSRTSVDLLEEVKLVISSTDLDGIESSQEVPDFTLSDDEESTYTFQVPRRLSSLNFSISAKIQRVSEGGKKNGVSASKRFEINGIDHTGLIADLHLSRVNGNYIIEVLGKTGEPLVDRGVNLQFDHDDFTSPVSVSLKSDPNGKITLGNLAAIESFQASGTGFEKRSWNLIDGFHNTPSIVHAAAGESVQIPLSKSEVQTAPENFAIFEVRKGTFVANHFSKGKIKDGILEVTGLNPGDYVVFLRADGRKIQLRVTGSKQTEAGWLLSKHRHLKAVDTRPLQIAQISAGKEAIKITLTNPGPTTRVHVFATRFLPEFPIYRNLGIGLGQGPGSITTGGYESRYISGRDIGEEYRYIIERRSAKKFPGNMAKRPSLILNPWALRDTETSIDDAEKGDAYKRARSSSQPSRSAPKPAAEAKAPVVDLPNSPNLDFLPSSALVEYNLKPGQDGTISVSRKDLGDRQHFHIVAVDRNHISYRQISLAEEAPITYRDLRLRETLQPAKHFTQRRRVTTLSKGASLKIADMRASDMETYDTLTGVYSVLSSQLSDSSNLSEFSFVLNWPQYGIEKKQELYSKYASHELSFFLSRRDNEFFTQTIKPYLANKRHKTFIDHYLLGDDLSEYLEPWKYGRLNIVERILLGRWLGGDSQKSITRSVTDWMSLLPSDPAKASELYRSALVGRRLSGGAKLQLGMAADSFAFAAEPMAPPAAIAGSGGRMRNFSQKAREETEEELLAEGMADTAYKDLDVAAVELKQLRDRSLSESLYRKLDSTQEWAENNYYHLPVEKQDGDLITVNEFWKDYAGWDGEGGFYSAHFPAATRNFAEAMLALAVLDLPFKSQKHKIETENESLTLTANSPVIVFHEEIEERAPAEEKTDILISQNFFRADDRYSMVNGERVDKFITGEFLTDVLYGCQVVLTNPTSSGQKLDLLFQLPEGAVPVNGTDYTKTYPIQLQPFSTETFDASFYFPKPSGEDGFAHYPVHVAKNESPIAWADSFRFTVVGELSDHDKASWDYISQFATEQEVLDYLERNNVHALNTEKVAWRAKNSVDFFRKTIDLLNERKAYSNVIWSYAIYHNDKQAIRDYLAHQESFLSQSGKVLECEIASIDPVERHWYQHLEYAPLVNARIHRLGRDYKILNKRFYGQYHKYMKVLSYEPKLVESDRLGVAYYMFLQDRIEEGLQWFSEIDADSVDSRLQYDYLHAYASLYREEPEQAAKLADQYKNYGVDKWRERFATISDQVKEINGDEVNLTDDEDRENRQDLMASKQSAFDLKAEGAKVMINYQNLDKVMVNYYEMDLEFLFSSQPFVSADSGQFSYIKPNFSESKNLPEQNDLFSFELPKRFHGKNVLVEVVGGGRKQSEAVYANDLKVRLAENYGRIEVRKTADGSPIPKSYIKVYARLRDGNVKFFKDGYTDLRGKFDYVSLNTGELEQVERLSILVMSEKHGAVVKEAAPPQM